VRQPRAVRRLLLQGASVYGCRIVLLQLASDRCAICRTRFRRRARPSCDDAECDDTQRIRRIPSGPGQTPRRLAPQAAPQLAAKAPARLRSARVRTRLAASRPGQARSPTLTTRCMRPRRSDARCAAGSQVVATFTVPAPASVPPTPAAPQLPPTLAPGKVFEVRAGCCAPLAAGALSLCAVRAVARALFILTRRGATWACLAPRRPL
jgi:hypothetical protein